MRRAATVLLCATLTTGTMVTLGSPALADDELVPRDLTITVTGLGPEQRTCQVDADLYVPAGVDADHPGPALLATNGFGGDKADQADLARGFGEHGYVTLSYTGLGFVDGDLCPITLDDREHDGAAAAQLLRFLGGDPSVQAVDDATGETVLVDQVIRQDDTTGIAHDPAVGMVGGSYGGQIQFAAAAVEHDAGTDRLDAIVPMITWNDLSYSLNPDNAGLPGGTAGSGSVAVPDTGVFKYQWSLLFTALGLASGLQDLPALADPLQVQNLARDNCLNFDAPVCRALLEVGATGYAGQESVQFLRSNSVGSYVSDITVPTLIAQGQADTLFNLQESVATYSALRAQGTPVSLVWQSWGHSDLTPQPGEMDMRHPARSHQGRQVLAWFDHYVRGHGDAPEPSFEYYRDWVMARTGDIEAAYASAPAYPAGDEETFTLSGGGPHGGALVDVGSAVTPGLSSYSSVAPIGPNYTETAFLDQAGPVTDPPGTTIMFSTEPLAQPMDVVGSPRLTVQLEAPAVAATQALGPAGRLVVFAKVYDVGPDGTVELPHRLISPSRVTDVTRPVTIELPGMVHRFDTGHRLAVVLTGGDLAYRGSTVPQQVGLRTGPGRTNELTVPVVR